MDGISLDALDFRHSATRSSLLGGASRPVVWCTNAAEQGCGDDLSRGKRPFQGHRAAILLRVRLTCYVICIVSILATMQRHGLLGREFLSPWQTSGKSSSDSMEYRVAYALC